MPLRKAAVILALLASLLTVTACVGQDQKTTTTGFRITLQPVPGTLSKKPDVRLQQIQAIRRMLMVRATTIPGVAEPIVELSGDDKVVVDLPGIRDKAQAVRRLTTSGRIGFYPLRNVRSSRYPKARWALYNETKTDKSGFKVYTFKDTVTHKVLVGDTPEQQKRILSSVVNAYDVKRNPRGVKPILTSKDILLNIRADIDPQDESVIQFSLSNHGAEVFADYTNKHIGEKLAVFLDGRMLTAPEIRAAIYGGKCQITGFASLEDAVITADILNTGELPVPIKAIKIENL